MPRIKTYDRLDPQKELGGNAELFIDSICFDASNMTVREMMVIYGPEILGTDEVILYSEDAGTWKWNRDRNKWERVIH
jgi:hypothetical protein